MGATAAIVTDARTDVVTIPTRPCSGRAAATVRTLASATMTRAVVPDVTSPTAPETRSVTLRLSNDQSVGCSPALSRRRPRRDPHHRSWRRRSRRRTSGRSGALRIGSGTGLGGGGFGGGAVRIGR